MVLNWVIGVITQNTTISFHYWLLQIGRLNISCCVTHQANSLNWCQMPCNSLYVCLSGSLLILWSATWCWRWAKGLLACIICGNDKRPSWVGVIAKTVINLQDVDCWDIATFSKTRAAFQALVILLWAGTCHYAVTLWAWNEALQTSVGIHWRCYCPCLEQCCSSCSLNAYWKGVNRSAAKSLTRHTWGFGLLVSYLFLPLLKGSFLFRASQAPAIATHFPPTHSSLSFRSHILYLSC